MTEKYWLVWREDSVPAFRHHQIDGAVDEAKRLARLHPGTQFHVLEYVGTAERVDVLFTPSETERDPRIPF